VILIQIIYCCYHSPARTRHTTTQATIHIPSFLLLRAVRLCLFLLLPFLLQRSVQAYIIYSIVLYIPIIAALLFLLLLIPVIAPTSFCSLQHHSSHSSLPFTLMHIQTNQPPLHVSSLLAPSSRLYFLIALQRRPGISSNPAQRFHFGSYNSFSSSIHACSPL